MAWRQNAGLEEVESFAKALCADQQDPALLVQARIIAENHLLRRAIRQRKLALMKRQMTPSQIKAEYTQQVIDKLLAAISKRFSEEVGELPSPSWLRKRYSSDEILEAIEEYFDGEELTALKKFIRRFLRHQPPPPREGDEFAALDLAGPEIDRLECYESRAWTRHGALSPPSSRVYTTSATSCFGNYCTRLGHDGRDTEHCPPIGRMARCCARFRSRREASLGNHPADDRRRRLFPVIIIRYHNGGLAIVGRISGWRWSDCRRRRPIIAMMIARRPVCGRRVRRCCAALLAPPIIADHEAKASSCRQN
jgi:hypothetical protein